MLIFWVFLYRFVYFQYVTNGKKNIHCDLAFSAFSPQYSISYLDGSLSHQWTKMFLKFAVTGTILSSWKLNVPRSVVQLQQVFYGNKSTSNLKTRAFGAHWFRVLAGPRREKRQAGAHRLSVLVQVGFVRTNEKFQHDLT